MTPEIFKSDFVKANKAHVCCECKGVIEKGERYHRLWGVWEGEHDNFKVCHDCEDLRYELDKDRDGYHKEYDELTPFGSLKEYIWESGNEEWKKEFEEIQAERRKVIV